MLNIPFNVLRKKPLSADGRNEQKLTVRRLHNQWTGPIETYNYWHPDAVGLPKCVFQLDSRRRTSIFVDEILQSVTYILNRHMKRLCDLIIIYIFVK